ncbi:FUSC family protein [Escherichia coli]
MYWRCVVCWLSLPAGNARLRAVLTAAIVAAGPAFAAGGEPYSGAIRYRGFLRIIGTFIGCIAGLVIIIAMIRAPLLMILVCCIWAGFCTWISSLVRIENSYAWGLAGYTALIIVITIQPEPLLTPQFAVERCSEIVIGIVCAIMADLLFSPRSIDRSGWKLESLLVAQYQLMQLCIKHGDGEVVDKAWGDLVRRTTALQGMRSNLNMEYSPLGAGRSTFKSDQYAIADVDYPNPAKLILFRIRARN